MGDASWLNNNSLSFWISCVTTNPCGRPQPSFNLGFIPLIGQWFSCTLILSSNFLMVSHLIRYFGDILEALFLLYSRYFKFNTTTTSLPDHIQNSPKFTPFKNCLGALDGVLVPAYVPLNIQSSWRSRKGVIPQNILAAANFNFEFVYVLAG